MGELRRVGAPEGERGEEDTRPPQLMPAFLGTDCRSNLPAAVKFVAVCIAIERPFIAAQVSAVGAASLRPR
ncbi:hypothetical protein MTsN3n11_03200 [Qipengyuania sp. MTN3-11]